MKEHTSKTSFNYSKIALQNPAAKKEIQTLWRTPFDHFDLSATENRYIL